MTHSDDLAAEIAYGGGRSENIKVPSRRDSAVPLGVVIEAAIRATPTYSKGYPIGANEAAFVAATTAREWFARQRQQAQTDALAALRRAVDDRRVVPTTGVESAALAVLEAFDA